MLNAGECSWLLFAAGGKLGAVLPMLYTKCQMLITFLGIYCKNMSHDASLRRSCGCSVLRRRALGGADCIWVPFPRVSAAQERGARGAGPRRCALRGAGPCARTAAGDAPPALRPRPPVSAETRGWDEAQESPDSCKPLGHLEKRG